MKKILSFLLAAIMLVACLPLGAFAAGSAAVTVEKKTAKPGDTVTLAFSIDKNAEFANYEMTLNFNKKLSLTAVNNNYTGSFEVNMNKNSAKYGKVVFANSKNLNGGKALFTATFEVPENIAPGFYEVSAKIHYIADEKNDDLSVSINAGGITIKCDHKWDNGKVTKEPSCGVKGVKTYTCTVCGETKTEEIAALNHKWDNGKITKEPSCGVKGVKTFTCSNCGATKTEDIAALNHKWDNGKVTKEPSCGVKGVKTFTCSNCDATKTEDIAALEHKWDNGKVTKAATCKETGVKTYTCSNCGETKTETIAKTEHNWDNGVVTKAATCTETGVKTFTCSICGDTKTETIAKTGHNWTAWYVSTEATCEEAGEETRACFNCDATETREIAALGHNWVEKITKAATCGADGEKTLTCSNCGETKTEVIPATGNHKYATKWFMNAEQHWHECTVCGHIADCDDHDFEWHIIKKATNKEKGLKQYICETCGYVIKEETLPIVEGLDDGPQTGDITGQLIFGAFATVMVLASGAWLVLKRKIAK